jgi:hypothetical protein
MGYPALVERALRLVDERGGAVAESELCAALFGASGRPWARMLGQVLAADGRLQRDEDGCWRSQAAQTVAEAPAAIAGSGTAGLVVLAGGAKPW